MRKQQLTIKYRIIMSADANLPMDLYFVNARNNLVKRIDNLISAAHGDLDGIDIETEVTLGIE